MRWICIIALLMMTVKSEKKFGLFKTEYEYVSNFLRESDILRCHFRLSRFNKTEKQITARLDVYKKIVDLKIFSQVLRKTPVTGYISESKGKVGSLCHESFPFYPILKRNFQWSLNETDCSLDEGVYFLPRYSMDEEIRNWIGNRTFYGNYKSRMIWLEGVGMTELCGAEIAYHINEVPEVIPDTGRKRKNSTDYQNHINDE